MVVSPPPNDATVKDGYHTEQAVFHSLAREAAPCCFVSREAGSTCAKQAPGAGVCAATR
jgi:hypothetical protein